MAVWYDRSTQIPPIYIGLQANEFLGLGETLDYFLDSETEKFCQ